MRRRSDAAGTARGQSLAEFAGVDEPGAPEPREGASAGRGDVEEGLGATTTGPGLGAPSMGPGFERIVERVFKVNILAEYEELEQGLKFARPAHRAEYSELVDALDEATDNARRAHLLVVNGKVALEGFELDTTVVLADMRDQARTALQKEKDAGQRSKQITDADVEGWMAHKFPDEWRETSGRRAKAKRMVEHLERLADLWKDRRSSLDTMVKGARRV